MNMRVKDRLRCRAFVLCSSAASMQANAAPSEGCADVHRGERFVHGFRQQLHERSRRNVGVGRPRDLRRRSFRQQVGPTLVVPAVRRRMRVTRTYAAWTLAQEMHTPDDITNPNPPEDDQPYAGVLYVDSLLYARKERWTHVWQLKLGVVGPASQAEDVQRDFHDLVGGG